MHAQTTVLLLNAKKPGPFAVDTYIINQLLLDTVVAEYLIVLLGNEQLYNHWCLLSYAHQFGVIYHGNMYCTFSS